MLALRACRRLIDKKHFVQMLCKYLLDFLLLLIDDVYKVSAFTCFACDVAVLILGYASAADLEHLSFCLRLDARSIPLKHMSNGGCDTVNGISPDIGIGEDRIIVAQNAKPWRWRGAGRNMVSSSAPFSLEVATLCWRQRLVHVFSLRCIRKVSSMTTRPCQRYLIC